MNGLSDYQKWLLAVAIGYAFGVGREVLDLLVRP